MKRPKCKDEDGYAYTVKSCNEIDISSEQNVYNRINNCIETAAMRAYIMNCIF